MPEVPAGIIEIHFKGGWCTVDPVMFLFDGFDRIIYIVINVRSIPKQRTDARKAASSSEV